jgi:hypothetical protein
LPIINKRGKQTFENKNDYMDAIGAAIVYFCLISTYNSQSRKAEYSAIIGQKTSSL